MVNQSVRVIIDENNESVKRIEEKCIKCGQCVKVCNEFVSVNNNYDINKSEKSICVNCGQCIKKCPMNSLIVKNEYEEVAKQLKTSKVLIVSTSPSVRVALGEEFGLALGSFVQGKMVALLRKLGFNYVLDTNFAADLTICEEASELVSHIQNGKMLPMFTSCCPAWIKFAEIFYPEILPNISSCKSPIGMQGAIVKTYFAKKLNINPKDIIHVALTPCVAKKMEVKRSEMNSAGKKIGDESIFDTDYVITTTELAEWTRKENIDFNSLEDSEFDKVMGQASGAGVIFGNTGGVMEAAVRTAYHYLTNKNPIDLTLNFEPVRGLEEIKVAEVEINNLKLKLAVVYGLKNAREIIKRVKAGEKYDFIEIMTCPGGCIGGGGQPKQINEVLAEQERIKSLYNRDKSMLVRASHENQEIINLYKEFLGKPNSALAEELLHTLYTDRSKDLIGKNNK